MVVHDFYRECLYYKQLDKIKNYFVKQNLITKQYEVHKIWSRWLISYINKHQFQNKLSIIHPKTDINENINIGNQMINELVNQGANKILCNIFYQKLNQMIKTQLMDPDSITNCHIKYVEELKIPLSRYSPPKTTVDEVYPLVKITCFDYTLNVSYRTYQKLKKKFVNNLLSNNNTNYNLSNFSFYVWRMLRQYQILDGHSLQWVTPERVMYILQKRDIFS